MLTVHIRRSWLILMCHDTGEKVLSAISSAVYKMRTLFQRAGKSDIPEKVSDTLLTITQEPLPSMILVLGNLLCK